MHVQIISCFLLEKWNYWSLWVCNSKGMHISKMICCQGGMRSKGSVSWKQASNTLSTTSSASCLLISRTHRMDFTALSLTHFCKIQGLVTMCLRGKNCRERILPEKIKAKDHALTLRKNGCHPARRAGRELFDIIS